MAANEDNDIVLGTGKLLALFFGIVITWAVFFGIGFLFGKSAQAPAGVSAASSGAGAAHAPKPSAGGETAEAEPFNKVDEPAAATDKTASAQPVNPAPAPVKIPAKKNQTPAVAAPPISSVNTQAAPPPVVPDQPAASPGSPTVQVAAVTKREDAQALMDALKERRYPVFIQHNPAVDPYFHVQVGPFVDERDAEATREQLEKDGYNAILKR